MSREGNYLSLEVPGEKEKMSKPPHRYKDHTAGPAASPQTYSFLSSIS